MFAFLKKKKLRGRMIPQQLPGPAEIPCQWTIPGKPTTHEIVSASGERRVTATEFSQSMRRLKD